MSNANKKTKKETLTIRLQDDLLTDVGVIAKADDRSLASVVRKALERCIPQMKQELGIKQ